MPTKPTLMATVKATPATRDTSTTPRKGDADADTDIDLRDLESILRAFGGTATGPDDPRDYDSNSRIRLFDLAKCATQCTRRYCAER